jgi:Raf kinase inhibitor-like YbhB/YbcL family protein
MKLNMAFVCLCALIAGYGIVDFAYTKTGGTMKLTSQSFIEGKSVPSQFTCEGADISPDLQWNGVPEGVQSFVLLCEDPDAPSPRAPRANPWVHWVVYNIPGNVRSLKSGEDVIKLGAQLGMTDSKKPLFHGPCPPESSGTHRYFFKLYALDIKLSLPNGATKNEVLNAQQGHILATAELMGTYER